MLNPNNDRLDYGQVLAPPDKYRLDFAIGTTYSLDLDALVGACIALGLSEETDSDLMKNPICLLEALRTTGDKVALFCEGGQIHTPNSVTANALLLGTTRGIRELGQGWVAEETLAIAIYCALKYSNDFDKALIASVNHSGDSDSTGAVTGNILGAYLGLSGIPEKYLKNLELKNVILELADDLFNDCKITEYGSYHDEIWEQKYIYKSYRPKR